MACLCGDLGCPSCGPAQGASPRSEAAFDYVYDRLEEWLNNSRVLLFQGDGDDPALYGPGQLALEIDCKLSDGNKAGLVRLTTFILDLMSEAVDAARKDDAASWAEIATAQDERLLAEVPPFADDFSADHAADHAAELEDRLERRGVYVNAAPISEEQEPGRVARGAAGVEEVGQARVETRTEDDEADFDWDEFYTRYIRR